MVVHYYYVILECSLLCKSRSDSVGDGLGAVENRYNHRSLVREVLLAVVGLHIFRRVYRSANLVEVLRCHLFHLYLHLAVARVDVVELALAALARVGLHLRVQILVKMENLRLAAYVQAQVVEARPLVVGEMLLRRVLVQQRCAYEHELSEVEVVAYAARLVVDGRMFLLHAVLLYVAVGVHHARIAVGSHAQQSVERMQSEAHRRVLQAQQHVFGVGMLLDGEQRLCRRQSVYGYHGAVADAVRVAARADVACVAHEQVYMLCSLALAQRLQRVGNLGYIVAGQKAINFLSHCCL